MNWVGTERGPKCSVQRGFIPGKWLKNIVFLNKRGGEGRLHSCCRWHKGGFRNEDQTIHIAAWCFMVSEWPESRLFEGVLYWYKGVCVCDMMMRGNECDVCLQVVHVCTSSAERGVAQPFLETGLNSGQGLPNIHSESAHHGTGSWWFPLVQTSADLPRRKEKAQSFPTFTSPHLPDLSR